VKSRQTSVLNSYVPQKEQACVRAGGSFLPLRQSVLLSRVASSRPFGSLTPCFPPFSRGVSRFLLRLRCDRCPLVLLRRAGSKYRSPAYEHFRTKYGLIENPFFSPLRRVVLACFDNVLKPIRESPCASSDNIMPSCALREFLECFDTPRASVSFLVPRTPLFVVFVRPARFFSPKFLSLRVLRQPHFKIRNYALCFPSLHLIDAFMLPCNLSKFRPRDIAFFPYAEDLRIGIGR